jgi:hypothetical protein
MFLKVFVHFLPISQCGGSYLVNSQKANALRTAVRMKYSTNCRVPKQIISSNFGSSPDPQVFFFSIIRSFYETSTHYALMTSLVALVFFI